MPDNKEIVCDFGFGLVTFSDDDLLDILPGGQYGLSYVLTGPKELTKSQYFDHLRLVGDLEDEQ